MSATNDDSALPRSAFKVSSSFLLEATFSSELFRHSLDVMSNFFCSSITVNNKVILVFNSLLSASFICLLFNWVFRTFTSVFFSRTSIFIVLSASFFLA
jgi:hypothetical protein